MAGVNVWGQVGAVVGYLPMSSLLGLTGQLLGMDVTATVAEWKAATFLANQLAVPVGSAAAPSFTFTGELGTGMYKSAVGKLALSVLGTKYFEIDNTLASISLTAHQKFVSKLLMEAFSANIVAAANIDLGTATGNYVYITNAAGDISITRLGGTVLLQAGTEMELKFKILGGSVTLKHDINFLNLPGGSDLKLADGDICRFRKTNSADQFWDLTSYSKYQSLSITAAAQQPVTLIYPDINDRPSMVAGGWLPWNLNQQWGGAGCMPFHMVDSATGTEFKFDAFDAYVDDSSGTQAVGNVVGQYYNYQVITPAKNLSLQAFWLKFYKNINPVDNFTVQLWSIAAGVPGALISTANVINGKQITSDSNGQWYRFPFAAVQALVAGTQYAIVMFKSAGVDAGNNYIVKTKVTTKYPNNLQGVGTVVPAWTATNTNSIMFIAEAQASDQPVQAAGTFDGKIVGTEGNPINRSVAYCNQLRNVLPIFNPQGWSILIRGKTFTKDRTIAEFAWGLHHDRINIRSAVATGFITVTLYESDGTINTITGNNDVSAATYKDILITGRSLNDGADYLRIYTGLGGTWQKEVEATAQSYLFDPLMLRLGTAWLMGGFQLFSSATYTNLQDMTVLPSAAGYTFTTTTGTAEGNVFAVSNGKLNSVKSGMAAGGDGLYLKNGIALSNVNGWFTATRLRVMSNSNTKDSPSAFIGIDDAVKNHNTYLQEYYTQSATGVNYYPQINNKDTDFTLYHSGKGSDVFVFANARLLIDGTSIMTGATADATGRNRFGDANTAANENADVVWDYHGYYNTTNIYPQFSSCEIHEFAIFPGDQGTLGQALYNSGVPVSVKQYCGVGKNWVGEPKIQKPAVRAIGVALTSTAATSPTPIADMALFVLGETLNPQLGVYVSDDTLAQGSDIQVYVDGVSHGAMHQRAIETTTPVGGGFVDFMTSPLFPIKYNFGLHKIEGRWCCTGNTLSNGNGGRVLSADVF